MLVMRTLQDSVLADRHSCIHVLYTRTLHSNTPRATTQAFIEALAPSMSAPATDCQDTFGHDESNPPNDAIEGDIPTTKRPRLDAGVSDEEQIDSGFDLLPSEQQQTSAAAGVDALMQSPAIQEHTSLSNTMVAESPAVLMASQPSASKRTFPCRTCEKVFSSTSNRLRHERSAHGGSGHQQPTMSAPESASRSLPSGHSRKRSAVSITRTTPSAVTGITASHNILRAARAIVTSPDENSDHETDDLELLQYIAATAVGAEENIRLHVVEEKEQEEQMCSTDMDDSSDSERSAAGHTTDSNRSATSPAFGEDEPVPGMPTLLNEIDLQSGCVDFLRWLATPAITPCESLVKPKKVQTLTQLNPIKANIRFLFTQISHLTQGKVDLEALTRVDMCQALFNKLNERGCGSARLHALALLCKKVLVFLSSRESLSKRQYVPPTSFGSYLLVENICSENSQRRKTDARNRALFGVEASRQLLQQQQQNGSRVPPFSIPEKWSSPPSSGSTKDNNPSRTGRSSSGAANGPPISCLPSAAAVVTTSTNPTANEMSKLELQRVSRFCLANLNECISITPTEDSAALALRDRWFQALLICSVLCMGLAPRSHALHQLVIGSTFVKQAEDNRYVMRLLADQCKNNRPTLVPLTLELTTIIDHFLDVVRPRLLAPINKLGERPEPQPHDYLFVKRNGTPRLDFRSSCNLVTQHAIGRAVNPHAWRSAIITALYQTDVSQNEMDTLAAVMSHSPAVARSVYFRPVFAQAAVQTSDKVKRLLLD